MQAKATYRPAMIGAMLVALLLAAHAAHAEAGGGKSAKLFADEATLPLTITAPWREFAHNKTAKASYPGTLEYVDDSGAKRAVPIVVTPRGHNRLKVCKFPPIKLIFEKEAIQDTLFHGNRSLKLVTRCANDEQSEQYIIKEMLAYRIYNLVTERSFRVRPLSVTYVDSADRSAAGAHFGLTRDQLTDEVLVDGRPGRGALHVLVPVDERERLRVEERKLLLDREREVGAGLELLARGADQLVVGQLLRFTH